MRATWSRLFFTASLLLILGGIQLHAQPGRPPGGPPCPLPPCPPAPVPITGIELLIAAGALAGAGALSRAGRKKRGGAE